MVINYNFEEGFFDYEIEYHEYQKALIHILLQQEKADLVESIIGFDESLVDLKATYKEELKDHFEKRAYKEFLDRRLG